jgi:hypothetical protein
MIVIVWLKSHFMDLSDQLQNNNVLINSNNIILDKKNY